MTATPIPDIAPSLTPNIAHTHTHIPNIALLDRVIKQIETEPETWDQDTFAGKLAPHADNMCGTRHCIAGWTVRFGRPDAEFLYVQNLGMHMNDFIEPERFNQYSSMSTEVLVDDELRIVPDLARDLLNISPAEANWLFYSIDNHGLADVKDFRDSLAKTITNMNTNTNTAYTNTTNTTTRMKED